MNPSEMAGVIEKVQALMISYPGRAGKHPHASLSIDVDLELKDLSTR
jgi:hypothetical protein